MRSDGLEAKDLFETKGQLDVAELLAISRGGAKLARAARLGYAEGDGRKGRRHEEDEPCRRR